MEDEIVKKLDPIIGRLAKYHKHKVIGLSSIPKEGACVIASNHSLATYDIALLSYAIYKNNSRIARPLIDKMFFKIPFLGNVMEALGAENGTRDNANKLLKKNELVSVAPGGMRESLRSSEQRYQFYWDTRVGFAKIALDNQCPIVLASCPRADDIYDVLPTKKLTEWAYKKFKFPVFLARGFGPTPFPKPVQLTHHLSKKIIPPAIPDTAAEYEIVLNKFHKQLIKKMEVLTSKAIQFRENDFL